MGRTRVLNEIVDAMRAYLHAAELPATPPDGVLAGLMGMVDASIVWWLDHHDETEEQLADRVSRQIAVVLIELLAQLGIEIQDDQVFRPSA